MAKNQGTQKIVLQGRFAKAKGLGRDCRKGEGLGRCGYKQRRNSTELEIEPGEIWESCKPGGRLRRVPEEV